MKKLKSFEEMATISERLKEKEQTVVFTNGCFDLIHQGHVLLLKKAKSLGGILIVGLNTDKSVVKLKGKNRPVLNQESRVEIIGSFEMVDYVVLFGEPTPAKLISKIKPDIIVKGGDYKKKDVVGKKTVEKYGGRVFIFPMVKNYSTTAIVKNLKARDN